MHNLSNTMIIVKIASASDGNEGGAQSLQKKIVGYA